MKKADMDGSAKYSTPSLYDMDGVPLYCWDGEKVVVRFEEELPSDRLPGLKADKSAELSAACNAAITAGCGVSLSGGSIGHISLTAEDQINLTNACGAVKQWRRFKPLHMARTCQMIWRPIWW